MDGEAIVRHMATQTLKAYGYQVSMAATAKEALAEIDATKHPFDLVLMDLHLPDKDGGETIQHLAQAHKELTPVVMSAVPSEGRCKQLFGTAKNTFLQKPFTALTLATTIRTALNES